jgi:hypothetical protein
MVCQCSSVSTSFMLAALRVLHVDTSHAPAGIAWIEEQPSLTPAPPPEAIAVSPAQNPTKQPDQEDKEAAARGATCVPTMSHNGIHTPDVTLVLLDQQKRSSRTARPAVTNPRISV